MPAHYCAVCGGRANIPIGPDEKPRYLCPTCNENFFRDLRMGDSKFERLNEARRLAREHNITLGYVLNVVCGRYSLQEAQKRNMLKQRDNTRKSTDIFNMGRRLPGSYK